MSVGTLISITIFITILVIGIYLGAGIRKLKNISDQPVDRKRAGRKVSIVVPACDEEENIEKAVCSLLAQEYEELEVIVVNDRSADGTAAILTSIKKKYPQLIILTVNSLPDGWMGKANALRLGAEQASGEYLLFTDADVQMEKTVIQRAVLYLENVGLDHLSLIFNNTSPGWLLNSLILDAGMGLLLLFRPWKVASSDPTSFIGVGAFNLVRKSVYIAVGGHRTIKMHPIDDVMLGKIIKEQGFVSGCLLAGNFVVVPWYSSAVSMINGLQKNVFAVVHYRLAAISILLLLILAIAVYPFWGILCGTLSIRLFCTLALAVRLLMFYRALEMQGLPLYYLPGVLVTPYVSCYIIVKATYQTLKNKGIIWRGRHYPLEQLRAAKPLIY